MIYEPAEDSYLLEEQVKKYSENKRVIDLGSGSGIQALAAMKSKAKSVLATDINPEVILKLKKIPCLKSNLFSNIKGKFDLIIFNPPYLPEDKKEDNESAKITTGGKKGDELILKFLKQANKHISHKGIILLALSSITPKKRITSIISKLDFQYKVISTKKFFMESLQIWKISRKQTFKSLTSQKKIWIKKS